MNNKELIASELAKVIDSLDQDAILNLLEQPKSSDLGDNCFSSLLTCKSGTQGSSSNRCRYC